MGETFGESPRPWTFVIGRPRTDSEGELIRSLPGTIERSDTIEHISQRNFDAAIIFGVPGNLEPHLMVIQIGGAGVMDGSIHNGQPFFSVQDSGRSSLLTIETENVPEGVSPADLRSLAQNIRDRRPHGLIHRVAEHRRRDDGVIPIVREKNGSACAGWWSRPGRQGSEFWWFPTGTPNLASWRSALYSRWNRTNPQKFPTSEIDWTKEPEWITVEETSALQELQKHDKETEEIIALRRQESNNLKQEVERISAVANSTTRLLLTAQGKQLVSAVESALSSIGFEVIDSDEQKEEGSYLLEDLKVMHEDWVCLAEVRGYTKGAKTSDLQRIERAVRHYEREHGTSPSARWYIVNHSLKVSPSDRPPVLSGATEDIDVFAEENGLVIDTRDLFRLAMSVREGRLTVARARELLMTTTGVLNFPPEQSHSAGLSES